MLYFSYFAYLVMLLVLLFVLKSAFDGLFLVRALQAQWQKDQRLINQFQWSMLQQQESWSCFYTKSTQISTQLSKQLTEPLLKLSALKGVAPALGMLFTVISIMLAFQLFSESGDIKQMFQAVSVGLGTTAIGAFCIVVSRLVSDRLLLPRLHHLTECFEANVRAIKAANAKRQARSEQTLASVKVGTSSKQAG